MNRDVIGTLGSGDAGDIIGTSRLDDTGVSSGGVCIGLSWSGLGSGSLKCSMDKNPWR